MAEIAGCIIRRTGGDSEEQTEAGGNAALRQRIDELRETLGTIEKEATAQEKAEDRRRWNEWITEGIDKGAARAHAYTRTPTAWTPTAAQLPDGSYSGAVEDLLNEQREKYARMWKPASHPFHYQWSGEEELPRISTQRLRSSAATFQILPPPPLMGFTPVTWGC